MGRWGQGAGTVEQMGLGGSVGRGGALEKLELSQSCELKHSSHSRLLYCSDEPRRDKNVSDFLKNHTHTQMPGLYLPPAQAWPICFPGGGREGALGVAPHSGHLSPGTQMAQAMVEGLEGKALPCPAAHASAGLSLESSTHTHPTSLRAGRSLPLTCCGWGPALVEFPLKVQIQRLRPKESLNKHQLSMNLCFTSTPSDKGDSVLAGNTGMFPGRATLERHSSAAHQSMVDWGL